MSTSRKTGAPCAPLEGPIRAPGRTVRSVMTPANGAVTRVDTVRVREPMPAPGVRPPWLAARRPTGSGSRRRSSCDGDVVAGDDSRRGGRGRQALERRAVSVSPVCAAAACDWAACTRASASLRSATSSGAPSTMAARQRSRSNRGPPGNRLHETADARIDVHGLEGTQFSRQRQLDVQRLLGHGHDIDRQRSCRLRRCVRWWRPEPAVDQAAHAIRKAAGIPRASGGCEVRCS